LLLCSGCSCSCCSVRHSKMAVQQTPHASAKINVGGLQTIIMSRMSSLFGSICAVNV
jgi:hypothetical protein